VKIRRLNIFHFWIIFLLILVLPVAREWRLLLNGERVEGTVVEMRKFGPGEEALIRLTEFRAVIEYRYRGNTHTVIGPENMKYEIGTKMPLIIHPEKEDKYIIASITGFYIHRRSITLIIVLLLWVAIYTTIAQMQKGAGSRRIRKDR
jgi:hypothetical protein